MATVEQQDEQSVEQFVNQQIKKWQKLYTADEKKKTAKIPVITVCMEPGAGGCLIGEQIANRLGFDFFHRDMVHRIAESARISTTVVDSLEKERLSGVQDFIASVIKEQYIHPSIYLEHLMKVVGTIGKHGHAVIVGRGANFIIPPKDRFAVRVVAPLEIRIENVSKRFRVPTDVAKQRVLIRENRRRAFIRQSFNADIVDPVHYDMILNTGNMNVDAAVEAVIGAVMGRLKSGKKKSR
ncbi:AAA family ATPase [Desulfatitalea tepidiphila]|uniref:cytidylate kinase-like family protein n=1 Tax=Desulfatitalea tepidiphila TaxID=1185843 RepID=UPI0006B634CB|nr:cytidylate kinase-like family protein [Desulfatitalea tepidiphila]